MQKTVFYYSTRNDLVKYISLDDDKIVTATHEEIKEWNHFDMLEEWTASEPGLRKFKQDMITMSSEIKKVKVMTSKDPKKRKFYNLDYLSYASHPAVCKMQFHQATGNIMSRLEYIAPESQEFFFHEKLLKSGLMTMNPHYKKKVVEAYGYDFSRYYVHLMIDKRFKFPVKAGMPKRYKSLNYKNLKLGIYHVKIDCENNRFRSMFNFSSDDHYDNETLMYVHTIRDCYDISMELILDEDGETPNAYVYEEFETGYDHFYSWYYRLEQIRMKCPKNELVKMLMSTLWGRLGSFNYEYVPQSEIHNYHATHRDDAEESEYKIIKETDSKETIYKIVKTNDAYETVYGRMKSFLTNFGRLMMLKMIHDFDLTASIIRIHTDGVIFNAPVDIKKTASMWDKMVHQCYYPKPDSKITGLMIWDNILYGRHICRDCDTQYKYDKESPMCPKCGSPCS
jgi:hypothetical protein